MDFKRTIYHSKKDVKKGARTLLEVLATHTAHATGHSTRHAARSAGLAGDNIIDSQNHDELGADRACPTAEAALLEQIPAGRMGTAEDVGRAAVWLASDDSEYVTGVTLRVDGGLILAEQREEG